MKIKTSELTNTALDWAVAKCEGDTTCVQFSALASSKHYFAPSKKWAQGGPIIEREGINVYPDYMDATTESGKEITIENGWKAHITPRHYWMTPRGHASGPTTLTAAMRCYVASKLGDEVEVPEELP